MKSYVLFVTYTLEQMFTLVVCVVKCIMNFAWKRKASCMIPESRRHSGKQTQRKDGVVMIVWVYVSVFNCSLILTTTTTTTTTNNNNNNNIYEINCWWNLMGSRKNPSPRWPGIVECATGTTTTTTTKKNMYSHFTKLWSMYSWRRKTKTVRPKL